MSVNIDGSDTKKLYIRVTFLNKLFDFMDEYRKVDRVIHAFPPRSLKKILAYRTMIVSLIPLCSLTLKDIPKDEDPDFIETVTEYLKLISAQLVAADKRYSHLEAKSRSKEKYTFSQDIAYMEHRRNIDEGISLYGRSINSYSYGCLLALHPERALEIGRLIKRNAR